MSNPLPTAEKDADVTNLDHQRRAKRDEGTPGPGEPAITFGMDDDRITFRDQAALDEYVAGAIRDACPSCGGLGFLRGGQRDGEDCPACSSDVLPPDVVTQ